MGVNVVNNAGSDFNQSLSYSLPHLLTNTPSQPPSLLWHLVKHVDFLKSQDCV